MTGEVHALVHAVSIKTMPLIADSQQEHGLRRCHFSWVSSADI